MMRELTPYRTNALLSENDCNHSQGQHTLQSPHPSNYHHFKGLPLLQRKEINIHGGQIEDQTSEISYGNICK